MSDSQCNLVENSMALRVKRIAESIAADRSISDYDLWHMRRRLEDELSEREHRGEPIPIDLIYARRIIIVAAASKQAGAGAAD